MWGSHDEDWCWLCSLQDRQIREQRTKHHSQSVTLEGAWSVMLMYHGFYSLSFNPPVQQAAGHGPTHLQAKIHYLLTAFETFTLTQYNWSVQLQVPGNIFLPLHDYFYENVLHVKLSVTPFGKKQSTQIFNFKHETWLIQYCFTL